MGKDWKKLVPYLDNEDMERKAQDFLQLYWDQNTIPLPIDLIVERDLGIHIELRIGLQRLDIDSCLAKNLKYMYISDRSWEIEVRYRFSVAHECSHFILHRDFIEQAEFSNPEEWFLFRESIDEKIIKRYDLQADSMAGKILIPKSIAAEAIDDALEEMKYQFEEFVEQIDKLTNETDKQFARIVGTKIAPRFDVSWEAAQWRIYYSPELMEQIKSFIFSL